MSTTLFNLTRRDVLAASAAAAAMGVLAAHSAVAAQEAGGDGAIRPFSVQVPEEALADLRRRLAATRWADRETVADQSRAPGPS